MGSDWLKVLYHEQHYCNHTCKFIIIGTDNDRPAKMVFWSVWHLRKLLLSGCNSVTTKIQIGQKELYLHKFPMIWYPFPSNFFSTWFSAVFITAIQTNLFEGTELSVLSPGPHVEAVENGSFKVVWQVMVVSILQEGPPPAFLAHWVYNYLCTPDVTAISVIDDDIVNPDIRASVKRVLIFLVIAEQKRFHIFMSRMDWNCSFEEG